MTYDKTSKKKILAYAEQYGRSKAISKFNIARETLYTWIRESQPGYVKPERKAFFRKLNPKDLENYVLQNPELTCEQIGLHFGVSSTAVNNALHKLGFSFKKRNFSTKSEMKPSEQNIKKK
jgi:transposase